jgi:5'-nucleotidase
MNRRKFIIQGGMTAGAMLLNGSSFASSSSSKLTILHTNDVHSRLDPFPMDGTRNAGMGGIAARAEIIRNIRAQEENVLLLDAGDIFQGTPYFNIFKGEPEMRAMQMMGYDAGVMGNHDFDAGMENFVKQLADQGKFPILMCNYGFGQTPMENHFAPYRVFKKGSLRIGVTGVGIELIGLVPESLYGNTVYLDPISNASRTAALLKKEKNCDMVICISHLGDKYSDNKVSDEVLAKESEHIDLILGGHTHRFFDKPREYTNKAGKKVLVNQVGWGGLQLGRLDYDFSGEGGQKLDKNQSILIMKNIVD